jgi:hypothetical protein
MIEDVSRAEPVPGPATHAEGAGNGMLRLALISTPRSGNTWTRALLGSLYNLEQIPVHTPEHVDWENLPGRCVIQIHWYPDESFQALLERHNVRAAVLARHPLDVLMSWLNYVYYIHQEGYCPGGGACLDCPIVGALPRSDVFLKWTRSEYARGFLFHSPAWWVRPGVLRIRYEDLVADAEGTLTRLADEIGERPQRAITEVVEANAIGQKKPGHEVWHFHYWQGQPGLWRQLIPAAEARAMVASFPEAFEILGYSCDPDERLEPFQADQNWIHLQLSSTREHLRLERAKHRKTINDLLFVREELGASIRTLGEEQAAHEQTRLSLVMTQAQLDAMSRELAPIETVPLVITRRLKRIAERVLRMDPADVVGLRGPAGPRSNVPARRSHPDR